MRSLSSVAVVAVMMFAGAVTGVGYSAAADGMQIKTLSNRADLISGGDALVEVLLPSGTDPTKVRVDVDGRDVSSSFAAHSDGRFVGMVTGLVEGENVVTARGQRGAARLTLTNHPSGGPVFSGPQTLPWRCDTEAQGLGPSDPPLCMADTKVEYFYRSSDPTKPGWLAYDRAHPPGDVARTTTDEGASVPFIVRQEIGTMNRAIYAFAVLWNPAREWTPSQPSPAWNGKLVFGFGGGAAMSHRQGTIGTVGSNAGTFYANDPTVDQAEVLGRGFAIAVQSLGRGAINTNDVTSAETVMMVKERLVEVMGEIRYTIGQGCSGGSINQQLISGAYPGLLDGIMPACSFQDWFTTGLESADCKLLTHHFNEVSPHLWANPAQRAAAAGHLTPTLCESHREPFKLDRYWWDPSFGCHEFMTGALPAVGDSDQDWIYHPENNPEGVRCTLMDDQAAVFGERPPERWGPVEKRIGRGFAPRPLDNVGIQYGQKALLANQITAEQFVDLNEKVGGLDVDFHYIPQRMTADSEALQIAYRTGRITSGNNWAQIPIMDQGSVGNAEIHSDVRGHIVRARLAKANGHAGNHVIWNNGDGGITGYDALRVIDDWLSRIETDTTNDPLEVKVVRNKPAEAVDKCTVKGITISADEGVCRTVYPYGATPRMAAGGPMAEDVFKCQLRPLYRDDYNGVFPPMTNAQFARLQKAFPDGVCDWSRPGVAEQQTVPWMSFANGPGGLPLGRAPQSRPVR